MDGYEIAGKLAEGRFGVVFAACHIETGQKVAIKKIRARRPMPGLNMDPWSRSAEREVEILSQVRHHHIIRLLDHVESPSTGTFTLVYERLAWDVETVLERRKPLEEGEVKTIMQMLLTGLAYLHGVEVMHRDIKPSNLLMEAATGIVKIADFGSARFSPAAASSPDTQKHCRELEAMPECEQTLTREVCTRWYKSPEMLFGSIDYDFTVDLWAVGCVLGVLLSPTGQAVFEGMSDIDQLCCIFKLRGTPREEDWPEVVLLPDYGKIAFTAVEAQPFALQSQGCCSAEALELLEALLQLNPAKRAMAAEALDANFFLAFPTAAQPQSLVSSLGNPDDLITKLPDEDFGSDGSDFVSPDWEFEAVPIETTSCGLWDNQVASGAPQDPADSSPQPFQAAPAAEPVAATARVRRSTPPPPKSGIHRYKPGVF